MRSFAIVLLLLAATLAPLSAADPGGVDAPDAWELAMDVPSGSVLGDLGGTDAADWYRFAQPEGMGLRVTFDFPHAAHYHLELRSDTGGWLRDVHLPTWDGEPVDFVLGSPTDFARFGIVSWGDSTAVTYNLTVVAVDLPDFTPTSVVVEAVPITTDYGPLYSGIQRRITVDVANIGGAFGTGWVDVFAQSKTDGRTTYVGGEFVDVAAGDSLQLTFDWQPLGVVGDVTIIAFAHAVHDLDYSNSQATSAHHVVVGGTGVGLTAATSYGTCAGYLVYGCAAAGAGPSGAFAFARGSGILAGSWAGATVGPDYAYAFSGTYAPFVYVGGYVVKFLPSGGMVSGCAYVVLGTCQGAWLP